MSASWSDNYLHWPTSMQTDYNARKMTLSKQKLFRPDSMLVLDKQTSKSQENIVNNMALNVHNSSSYKQQLLLNKIQKPTTSVFAFVSTTFKNFADQTTMHGFREFYYSKSYIWKTIWLLAVLSALGAAGYQLFNQFTYSLNEPKSTVIQPLMDLQEAEYPTLRICYIHWMFWIDWIKGIKEGFNKQAILYGLSFLNDIISESAVDINQAKMDFESRMSENGYTSLIQFFDALSPKYPPGMKVQYLQNTTNWTKTLDPAYWRLCYVLYDKNIKEVLAKMVELALNTKNAIELEFDNNYFKLNTDYMSSTEYEVYAAGYVEKFIAARESLQSSPIERINMSSVKVSPTIVADGVRTNSFMIAKEMFEARIRLTGTLYKWLSSDGRKCVSKKPQKLEYCDKYCYWMEIDRFQKPNCIEVAGAELIDQNDWNSICRHHFYFTDGTMLQGNFPEDLYRRDAPWALDKSSPTYLQCIEEQCATPCDHWKFISTLSAVPIPSELVELGLPTLIDIEYPQSIIVFTEVASLTWESLIGNIGGICGLWLGASVISILQLVYLCCCSACDNKISTIMNKLNSK